MILIAFFDGQSWITGFLPFILGLGERDILAVQVAELVFDKALGAQVPTGVGGERDLQIDGANAADLVAVLVD